MTEYGGKLKMEPTKHEAAAMRKLKDLLARGERIGRRRIVSMQGCEAAGLVRRIVVNGLVVDWMPTPAAEVWNG